MSDDGCAVLLCCYLDSSRPVVGTMMQAGLAYQQTDRQHCCAQITLGLHQTLLIWRGLAISGRIMHG